MEGRVQGRREEGREEDSTGLDSKGAPCDRAILAWPGEALARQPC